MKKTEFILIGLLIALIISVGLAQFVKAEEKKYFVYLPFVANNTDLRPAIEFTYVAPYNIDPYVPPGQLSKRRIQGRVFNVNLEEVKLLIYYYSTDGKRWESIGLYEPGVAIKPDGSFDSGLSIGPYYSGNFFRGYLVRKDYPNLQPERGDNLPPDPPADGLFAMTEIERLYPEGWRVIQRKP